MVDLAAGSLIARDRANSNFRTLQQVLNPFKVAFGSFSASAWITSPTFQCSKTHLNTLRQLSIYILEQLRLC